MPHAYVHTGFWTNYNEPLSSRWLLTLGNLQATVLLCGVVVYLVYVQARTWVLVRCAIIKITMPIHLPSDLNDLSQGIALASFKHLPGRACIWPLRDGGDVAPWAYKLSPVFGVIALLNILVFITIGVMIPIFLSDGMLGAPEVRSRRTDTCLETVHGGLPKDFWTSRLMRSDEIWEHCHGANHANTSCDPNFARIKWYSTDISTGCLFPSPVCIDGLPTVTFTRANLTAHDLGINSKLTMTVSQRMSCSPISLRPFTWKELHNSNQTDFFLSIENQYTLKTNRNSNLSLPLLTTNAPGSGREVYNKGSEFQLRVLPQSDFGSDYDVSYRVHSSLRRRDGQAFVIVLRAGSTLYPASPGPIRDPFFSAHTVHSVSDSSDKIPYFPDMEATALACIEQGQVCHNSDEKCYPWSDGRKLRNEIVTHLEQSEDYVIATNYFNFITSIFKDSSVHGFLRRRLTLLEPLLLAAYRLDSSGIGIMENIDPKRQWILELEALFIKAIYWQKIKTLTIVQNDVIPENATSPRFFDSIWTRTLCDRTIFRDGGFVNINWVGLCAIVLCLLLVCILSYYIPQFERLLDMTLNATNLVTEHAKVYANTAWKPLFHQCWWERNRLKHIYEVHLLNPWRVEHESLEINLDTLQGSLEEEPDNPI